MIRNRAKDNLRAAANIIERRGLKKGDFGGEQDDDPVCLLRAIQMAKATPVIWEIGQECVLLREFLGLDAGSKVFPRSIGSRDRESRAMGVLLLWAEAPERTAAQVCNALLRASA